MNKEAIDEYCQLYLDGVDMCPIDVFQEGSEYWLAAGFHRYNGAKKANKQTINVKIYKGSAWEAFLFGIQDNVKNGVRRSNADKRYAVERILDSEHCDGKSARQIAEMACVSHVLVNEMIAERRARVAQVETEESSENGVEAASTSATTDAATTSDASEPSDTSCNSSELEKDEESGGRIVEPEIDYKALTLANCQRVHRQAKHHCHKAKKLMLELAKRQPYLTASIGRIKRDLSQAATAIHQMEPQEWHGEKILTRHDVQTRG